MSSRKSYPAAFKLSVVRELTEDRPPPSVRSLAQRHGITPAMVRKWLSNKSELEAAVALDGGSGRQRKLGSGRRPNAAVDAALLEWINNRQEDGVNVTVKEMQEQAKVIAEELGLTDFHASNGYIYSFKNRNKLSTSPVSVPVDTSKQERGPDSGVTVQVSQEAAAEVKGDEGNATRECMFGMDIGLKSVKCALESERSVENVLLAVFSTVTALPTALRQGIRSVGICGVMHGILWWRCDSVRQAVCGFLSERIVGKTAKNSDDNRPWSVYITYLDQRCTPSLLTKWRTKIEFANTAGSQSTLETESTSSSFIASGYGVATFAYMLEKQPHNLEGFDTCGTIQDFVAFALCGHSRPTQNCMDTTNAFSWGGFDIDSSTWNLRSIKALGLPIPMLPVVKSPGTIIGNSTDAAVLLGLPKGKPVYLPMGDHPCAVMTNIAQTQSPAHVNLSRTTVLNIGTTSQLAMVLTEEDAAQLRHSSGGSSLNFELRPFLSKNWFIGVAPSLSGGNMFAWFVNQCQAWSRQLVANSTAEHLSEEAMYAQLLALGGTKLDTDLKFSPTLNGEWASPDVRGSIDQLRFSNWSLGDISAAICRGLVDNIFSMVPEDLRGGLLLHPMIGSGQALVRNSLLQHFIRKKLVHPSQLSIQSTADSAAGVAFIPSLLQT